MEASQSPSVSNSAGNLMRQSSTVSGEAKNGGNVPSSALQVLKAAASRAEKWKAGASAGTAGAPIPFINRFSPRLLLNTEAPVLTPTSIDDSFIAICFSI